MFPSCLSDRFWLVLVAFFTETKFSSKSKKSNRSIFLFFNFSENFLSIKKIGSFKDLFYSVLKQNIDIPQEYLVDKRISAFFFNSILSGVILSQRYCITFCRRKKYPFSKTVLANKKFVSVIGMRAKII